MSSTVNSSVFPSRQSPPLEHGRALNAVSLLGPGTGPVPGAGPGADTRTGPVSLHGTVSGSGSVLAHDIALAGMAGMSIGTEEHCR